MTKKRILIALIFLLIAFAVYPFIIQKKLSSSPSYVNVYGNGLYEVRSFADSNPLCGYDEVVEVSTNKLIYSARMCESNIIDVQQKNGDVIIIKSSMAGREEIVISQ